MIWITYRYLWEAQNCRSWLHTLQLTSCMILTIEVKYPYSWWVFSSLAMETRHCEEFPYHSQYFDIREIQIARAWSSYLPEASWTFYKSGCNQERPTSSCTSSSGSRARDKAYSARSPSWRTMPTSPAIATPSKRPSGSSRAADRYSSGFAKLCSHRTSYLTRGMAARVMT